MLGATIQNMVAQKTWRLGFLYLCFAGIIISIRTKVTSLVTLPSLPLITT